MNVTVKTLTDSPKNLTGNGSNLVTSFDSLTTPWMFPTDGQTPDMSDSGGGGGSIGVAIGAGVGGCALLVGIIAAVLYCYMKARKENAKPNMTKSMDVFSTGASNTQYDVPIRSRVNQYPDPKAAREARRKERDQGHSNPGYVRHSSETSSNSSDVDGRDLSPPRRRRPRGSPGTGAFSSDSSYDDSSSVDDDVIGRDTFRMEKELDDRDKRNRSSYKQARQNDLLDDKTDSGGRYRRTGNESRVSRKDEFERNPRSDSPLTIGSLRKHEARTRKEEKTDDKLSSKNNKSRRREPSPSSRTYESSEFTQASLTTEGTMTTTSSSRFQKNPSLRRNSPSRSSSHRRYRKDQERDSSGRRKPRRTRSSDRDRGDRDRSSRDRSRSPGGSQRSSSSRGSQRSRTSSRSEARKLNREQAVLPIFQNAKKSSAV